MTDKYTRLIAAAMAALTLAACTPAPSGSPDDTDKHATEEDATQPAAPGTEGETEPSAPARPVSLYGGGLFAG